MVSTRVMHSRFLVLAISTILAFALPLNAASTTKVHYAFTGGNDGEYLDTDLVIDSAGNLYGSTVQGGAHSSGTVFQLSPSGSGWTHTVLYSFGGSTDGGEPYKGVTLAETMYGNMALRQTGDIDLLIRPQDFPQIKNAVRELGYTPHMPLSETEEQAYLSIQRQSRQKRKTMKEIAEAIILGEDVRSSSRTE